MEQGPEVSGPPAGDQGGRTYSLWELTPKEDTRIIKVSRQRGEETVWCGASFGILISFKNTKMLIRMFYSQVWGCEAASGCVWQLTVVCLVL